MSKSLFLATAFVTGFAASVAQAQEAPTTDAPPVSQADASATPSVDASSYGGTRARSASGAMTRQLGTQQPDCVGPASFCDIFKGGQ
ncbi:hypothetical protein [Burkholderia sp. 8Y]|uniref:hypothetical protein n=1 Tax=Burkholderia sp. 8Y TaxID=2653133 RepID=UPI00135923A0|nr:hypothetical protein [Burkholderia sp. 8Y]